MVKFRNSRRTLEPLHVGNLGLVCMSGSAFLDTDL